MKFLKSKLLAAKISKGEQINRINKLNDLEQKHISLKNIATNIFSRMYKKNHTKWTKPAVPILRAIMYEQVGCCCDGFCSAGAVKLALDKITSAFDSSDEYKITTVKSNKASDLLKYTFISKQDIDPFEAAKNFSDVFTKNAQYMKATKYRAQQERTLKDEYMSDESRCSPMRATDILTGKLCLIEDMYIRGMIYKQPGYDFKFGCLDKDKIDEKEIDSVLKYFCTKYDWSNGFVNAPDGDYKEIFLKTVINNDVQKVKIGTSKNQYFCPFLGRYEYMMNNFFMWQGCFNVWSSLVSNTPSVFIIQARRYRELKKFFYDHMENFGKEFFGGFHRGMTSVRFWANSKINRKVSEMNKGVPTLNRNLYEIRRIA